METLNRIFKYTFLGAVGAIVLIIVFFLFEVVFLGYSKDFTSWQNYTWLIKGGVKTELNRKFISYYKDCNTYSVIWYSDKKRITIWEFKELSDMNLNSIKINKNANLYEVNFFSGEEFNSGSDRTVNIGFYSKVDTTLEINLDNQAIIEKEIKTENYKGFYGEIYRMSFSNSSSEHQLLMKYEDGLTPVLFLLYKARNSFFILIIDSTEPFDESIINDLNLKVVKGTTLPPIAMY